MRLNQIQIDPFRTFNRFFACVAVAACALLAMSAAQAQMKVDPTAAPNEFVQAVADNAFARGEER